MTQKTKTTDVREFNVVVVGAGPAGMLAALKLATIHNHVALIGPDTNPNDMRTTALMMPAIRVIDELGIWENLKPKAAALSTMRIIDGTNRLIRSPTVSFRASEIGETAFGYNIPNTALNEAIANAVNDCPNIVRFTQAAAHYRHYKGGIAVTLTDDSEINTALLIAADGRTSPAREAAGIETRQWRYPQTAVILSFSHTIPHQNISTEFHTAEGPFTQVPLPGNRSSLVWVQNPDRANRLLGLGPKALGLEIERHMQSMLGPITVETPVQGWPMGGAVPKSFAKNRTILIGEAAHVFPPIGAQGLNLGIRDVVDLAAAVATDTKDQGSERVITYYNRHRCPDIWMRTGSVHMLNRALLSDALQVQIIRSAGLEMLRRSAPLRTFFMREGMSPGHGISCLKPRLFGNR